MKLSHLAVGLGVGLISLVAWLPSTLHAAALIPSDTVTNVPVNDSADPSAKKRAKLTYTKDIAPIIYAKCTECHRSGEVAPFALQSYEDVSKRAKTISAVIQSRYMPPWKADSHGEFVGERRLTPEQINTFQQWVQLGAPEGNRADLPKMPEFPNKWHLGTPDLLVQPETAYTLAADGNDVYRCFVIPTHEDADRYLSAIEVHPGNGKVVHHIIAYLDTSGKARELEAKAKQDDPKSAGYTSFGGPGFTPSGALGGWVPGYNAMRLPDGVGMLLPKGADIVLQVHYHKDGKPETDLSKMALYYSKTPVDKLMRTLTLINLLIDVPPGDSHYTAKAHVTLPDDITAIDVLPHMHLVGHDMDVEAALPNKTVEPLVKVPDWDFNWQTRYVYKQPLALPKGTQVSLVAHYDNSATNPRNPNTPPKEVTWGEQTTDEMCIAFIGYTIDAEHLTKGVKIDDQPIFTKAIVKGMAEELISEYDKDGDGKLNVAEMANMIDTLSKRGLGKGRLGQADPTQVATQVIALFDRNGDHALDADEMTGVVGFMRNFGKNTKNAQKDH